jgi:hypothetical protein
MSSIFVCYNRQSEAIVKTLIEDVETLGHTVWFDQDLTGGQAWWDHILATVLNCDIFIFVLDPRALSSNACKGEYSYAADLGKPILPILVAEGVSTTLLPPALSQIHVVDYRKQDREAGLRLARAIAAVPPPKPLPDPLPTPPNAPISYIGRLAEQIETTETLSYDRQSTLVFDLKQSLRDPEHADDGRALLATLRKRRDVYASIAQEIDELFGNIRKVPEESTKVAQPPGKARSDVPSESEEKPRETQLTQRASTQHFLSEAIPRETPYESTVPVFSETIQALFILCFGAISTWLLVQTFVTSTKTAGDYFAVFFILGLLIVASHARQRFNMPSFSNQEILPGTVPPLRYLFLRRAYRRALLTYVTVSLLLYSVLVLLGQSIIPALSAVGVGENFPQEAWALLVALLLVGFVPNSHLKWLTSIEEYPRRWVHAWFFVPEGIVRTIGFLEDARYEPPASQLDVVASPLRRRLRNDLKLPTNSLRYRWARATMLIASLRQMGAGTTHPLDKAAFEPFREDFDAIVEKHRALAQEVEALGDAPTNDEMEDNLTKSVDKLLRQIYAYISWGIRHQANREQDVDHKLEEFGFRVPPTGGRRLVDIVLPTVLSVALITMLFWLSWDAVSRMMGAPGPTLHWSVVYALMSAVAASLMYGCAVFIALDRRSAQIEQKVWRQGSPSCLVPIAIRAGVVTWLVIIGTSALGQLPDTLKSLTGLVQVLNSLLIGDGGPGVTAWSFLPIKVATALPLSVVGATASVLLASLMSGDVRRTETAQRARDAVILGGGLGLAAALAQLIQTSFSAVLIDAAPPLDLVPIVGLAGFACGAVVGFLVPQAYRANLVTPPDRIMARELRDLVREAETTLGTRTAAEDWVFMPHKDLGGITPAEAIQYKTHATGVRRLLEREAPPPRQTTSGVERNTSPSEELLFRAAPGPQGGAATGPPHNGVEPKAGAEPSGRAALPTKVPLRPPPSSSD